MSAMLATRPNRVVSQPKQTLVNFGSLPVRQENFEQAQLRVYCGGSLESGFLTYAVGYAAATGAAVLVATGHPGIAAGVAIGAGIYALATVIDPGLNYKIAEGLQGAANSFVSTANNVGDMVSAWWSSGPNHSLSFGNGYW